MASGARLGRMLTGGIAALLACTALAGSPQTARILSLTAERREAAVVVRWEAQPDPSIAGYRLERLDGDRYVPAGEPFVPALPIMTDAASFSTMDNDAPSDATLVYRLGIVGSDGSESVSGPYTVTPTAPAPTAPPRLAPADIQAAASEVAPPAAPAEATAGDRIRIAVQQSGWYAIDADRIASCLAGASYDSVTSAIAAGGFCVSNRGDTVAWLPAPGATGLLFYAEALDSIYTRSNVYWILPEPGPVIAARTGAPPAAAAPPTQRFAESIHLEQDTSGNYNHTIFSDPEDDIWFWSYLYPPYITNISLPFDLHGVDGAPAGSVTVYLKGATKSSTDNEHHARIIVNGVQAGAADWNDIDACTVTAAVANLAEGANSLRIQAFKLTNEPVGTFYIVDSFDVAYDRTYRAWADSLACRGGTNPVVTVDGLSHASPLVLDLSDRRQPLLETAVLVDAGTDGLYRATFAPSNPAALYLVTATAAAPPSVSGDAATAWRSPTNRGGYVVIAPAAFRPWAARLASMRRAQGFTTAVVDIEDVYDEFAHGLVTPHAIGAFIAWARANWAVTPSYVVLAGAGTLDYRAVSGLAQDPCLIPAPLVATPDGLFGSDVPLADTDGDGAPNVYIGRLPAISTNELAAMIDKIAAYERHRPRGTTVMLMADNPDASGDFVASSDLIAGLVPAAYPSDLNYFSTQSVDQVRARLMAALNSGWRIVHYFGHGNDTVLGENPVFLSETDLPQMNGPDSPSVLLAMTCVFGRFDRPSSKGSLAERMVRRTGGGPAAVWSCATTVLHAHSEQISVAFMEELFGRNDVRLGPAIQAALARFVAANPPSQHYPAATYELLGDPALCPRFDGFQRKAACVIIR